MTDQSERRSTPRVPIAARVHFKEGAREEFWMTEDLSEGGLFLITEKPPFAGAVLSLEISLPDMEELIKLQGEVVWRHEGRGCGVRFVRVTAEIRKRIRNYVQQVTKEK